MGSKQKFPPYVLKFFFSLQLFPKIFPKNTKFFEMAFAELFASPLCL